MADTKTLNEIILLKTKENNTEEVIKLLSSYKFSDYVTSFVIIEASIHGNLEIIKKAVSYCNSKIKFYHSPIYQLISNNFYRFFVESLVFDGISATIDNYQKAVSNAFEFGHLDLVKFFIEKNFTDFYENAFQFVELAASNNHIEILQFLVDKNIDISSKKCQAIIAACNYEKIEAVKFLIDCGAYIQGDSILVSTSKNNFELTKLLLKSGSREIAININEALKISSSQNFDKISILLSSFGAKENVTKKESVISKIDKFINENSLNKEASENLDDFLKKLHSSLNKIEEIFEYPLEIVQNIICRYNSSFKTAVFDKETEAVLLKYLGDGSGGFELQLGESEFRKQLSSGSSNSNENPKALSLATKSEEPKPKIYQKFLYFLAGDCCDDYCEYINDDHSALFGETGDYNYD